MSKKKKKKKNNNTEEKLNSNPRAKKKKSSLISNLQGMLKTCYTIQSENKKKQKNNLRQNFL